MLASTARRRSRSRLSSGSVGADLLPRWPRIMLRFASNRVTGGSLAFCGFLGKGVYSMLCTLAVREASGRHLPDIKWGRLVASERQPKQPSSCPDTPPTHDVPLLPVWPLTAGPRARLRRNLVTAVVTPVHRCDGCLSDRDKQAS